MHAYAAQSQHAIGVKVCRVRAGGDRKENDIYREDDGDDDTVDGDSLGENNGNKVLRPDPRRLNGPTNQ